MCCPAGFLSCKGKCLLLSLHTQHIPLLCPALILFETQRLAEGSISTCLLSPASGKSTRPTPVAPCWETWRIHTYLSLFGLSTCSSHRHCVPLPQPIYWKLCSRMVLQRLCRHRLRGQETASLRLKLRALSKGAWSWVSVS